MPPHEPRSDQPPVAHVVPLYTLYSPGQVALATFLGTPLAGCWLIARNFKKLGARWSAWAILALGIAWTAGLCGLAVIGKLPGVVSLGSIPASVLLMRGLQGGALDRHASLGGKPTSWGYAVLGSLACLAIVFAAAVGVAIAYVVVTADPSVSAPNDSEVLYADGATEVDALRLRDALAKSEYFSGPSTVRVQRAGERWIVSYAVTDEGLRDPETARSLGDMSGWLSHEVFSDQPVDTVLIDEESVARVHVPFERRLQTLAWNTDELRYRELTGDQARAIGQALIAAGFFDDRDNVALAEQRVDAVHVELFRATSPARSQLDDLIYRSWATSLSAALDGAAVDLSFGDLEGSRYVTFRWVDHPPAPAHSPNHTLVFYRAGATPADAEAVAGVLDDPEHAFRAIVERDSNYDAPRFAVTLGDAPDAADRVARFARLAEPLSAALHGVPVDLRLADRDLATHTVLTWETRPKAKRGRQADLGFSTGDRDPDR